jgi:hypothetical protein
VCQCRVHLMLPVRKIASMTAEPKARAGLMGEPPAYCRRACMQMHECGGGRAGGAVSGVRPRQRGRQGRRVAAAGGPSPSPPAALERPPAPRTGADHLGTRTLMAHTVPQPPPTIMPVPTASAMHFCRREYSRGAAGPAVCWEASADCEKAAEPPRQKAPMPAPALTMPRTRPREPEPGPAAESKRWGRDRAWRGGGG